MKEKYCKIPKFRFNKFLESWERLKYEDVIEVNSGKDYKHLDKGDIPVYGTGGYMLSVSEAITDKDGVGIGRKGTINKPYILKAPYWTVDTLFFCIPKNKYNLYFINAIFERTQWERFDESTGVPSLSKLTINNIQNYFPSFNEQSAIGSLFRTLDDLLASYKDNLANYQSLKATMLSKMFPKAGQTVPEIRLDGFEGGWEEKEFSKLVKRVTQSSDSNSLPKVEFEDIISGQGRLNKDISNKFDNRKGIHFEPGYTLYGKLRPYLNNWLLPKFEGVALGDFWVFDPNGNDSNFIYYLVQSNRYQKVANDTSGTKMPRSDWKSVSSTIFAIPQTVAEQQAIGSYFSNLDNLIAAHQDKISQLETLKKKLLQDMFI
ncbi:restriction endonuclease subunit S [Streptococcus parasanguinis]|uniref:restriction endonuclease subunit S n=1 Tax=Streptococcus parasanguinis TaxID=1318 RepID=UPI0019143191|nr:restriction endonuclease subunit S [Streptococcus parasanguinis]